MLIAYASSLVVLTWTTKFDGKWCIYRGDDCKSESVREGEWEYRTHNYRGDDWCHVRHPIIIFFGDIPRLLLNIAAKFS